MKGLSRSNLKYMRQMAGAWPSEVGQQAVGQLPWGHVTVLLDKLDDTPTRDWYAHAAVDSSFIDQQRLLGRRVESVCQVLRELGLAGAPRTYRSWRCGGGPAARVVSDAQVVDLMRGQDAFDRSCVASLSRSSGFGRSA